MPTNGQPDPLGLGDLITCLVQGVPPLKPIEPPPKGFRMRAWQDKETGTLQLRVAGLQATKWKAEVAFDDPDPKDTKNVNAKKAEKGEKDLQDNLKDPEAGVEFDLPESWKNSSGPRFVTVYLRKKIPPSDEVTSKKRREEPSTIIRIIPAPIPENEAEEFGELEPLSSTDE